MGKKEEMLNQLKSERKNLPGGLQTLIRGGEDKTATPQAADKTSKAEEPTKETAERGKVGRPKLNMNDYHTSLVIDHDLYLQMKMIALNQGGRSIKEIINEALVDWVNANNN